MKNKFKIDLKKPLLERHKSNLSAETPFRVAEAYRTIRTNLLFALAAKKGKIVVISSALSEEGKSTTCSNLAIAMAQTEASVLLIDADLRKPTQYQIFRKSNKKGLSSLLVGFDSLDKVLHKKVELNLDLIPSGPIPPNPSELLSSENMTILLQELAKHYDYIFIDAPPINIVTDPIILARKTDGIVLVARQGQSTYDELNKAVGALEFAQATILGIVINDVKEDSGYGRYKYKYKKYEKYSSK